jgi:phenylacetate-CoA ligase
MNSQVQYQRRRLADMAAALRLARTQTGREHGPRAQLARHQQQRLETVVRHAAAHSPFYRRWFAQTGALGTGPVDLARLPVLDKSLLMEHFDELVCDPRLRRDELLDRVGKLTRDQLYLDRYRVMVTSGSSGRPGLFVYDPAGWRSIIAQMLRSSGWAGLRPSLPRQRVAWLGGAGPSHITRQGAATVAIGLHRVLSLPVTLPLPRLVEALNQFQPTYLNVYPSVAMWLADEQHAGRLQLAPQMLITVAELRTPAMTQRLQDAFGVRPFDVYGSTEGLFGTECQHHQGIHLFEDTTLVENVDADGQPVPAGQPGTRLLVTNLHNLVQPLLRLGVTDLVTLAPDPCRCGRTLIPGQHHPRPQRRRPLPALPRRRPGRRPPAAVRPAHPRPQGPRVPGRPGRPGPAHPHRPQRCGGSRRHSAGHAARSDGRPATRRARRPRPTGHRRAPPQAPPLSRWQAQARHRRPRLPTGPQQRPLTPTTPQGPGRPRAGQP